MAGRSCGRFPGHAYALVLGAQPGRKAPCLQPSGSSCEPLCDHGDAADLPDACAVPNR